jgi:ankyrin repeat protein
MVYDEPEADVANRLEVAKVLIADPRINISEVNWIGYTILIFAILCKDEDLALCLMENGANINFSAPEGIPFEYAVGPGCWRVAEKLVQMGAHRGMKKKMLMKALQEKREDHTWH